MFHVQPIDLLWNFSRRTECPQLWANKVYQDWLKASVRNSLLISGSWVCMWLQTLSTLAAPAACALKFRLCVIINHIDSNAQARIHTKWCYLGMSPCNWGKREHRHFPGPVPWVSFCVEKGYKTTYRLRNVQCTGLGAAWGQEAGSEWTASSPFWKGDTG